MRVPSCNLISSTVFDMSPSKSRMKLHGLTPVVSLIYSAESAEALTLLRSSSYGGSVRRIHPRAYAQGLLRRRIKRKTGEPSLTPPSLIEQVVYDSRNTISSPATYRSSRRPYHCT